MDQARLEIGTRIQQDNEGPTGKIGLLTARQSDRRMFALTLTTIVAANGLATTTEGGHLIGSAAVHIPLGCEDEKTAAIISYIELSSAIKISTSGSYHCCQISDVELVFKSPVHRYEGGTRVATGLISGLLAPAAIRSSRTQEINRYSGTFVIDDLVDNAPFSSVGDAGACVTDNTGAPIGLVIARRGKSTYAVPLINFMSNAFCIATRSDIIAHNKMVPVSSFSTAETSARRVPEDWSRIKVFGRGQFPAHFKPTTVANG